MTYSWILVIPCLLFASQGWAEMDNNHQKKKMVNNMLAIKMVEVEETKLKAEMEEKREKFETGEVMRAEMEKMKEKVEELEEKDNIMRKRLNSLETRNTEITTKLKEVDQKALVEMPFVMTCAYQEHWNTPSATITYDRLSADFNNAGQPGGGDGKFDIFTGVYVALTSGHYTITMSGVARVNPGEKVTIEVMHNDQTIGPEGWWETYASPNTGGNIIDQGSLTVIIYMELGDTLYLRTDTQFIGELWHFNLCITLTA